MGRTCALVYFVAVSGLYFVSVLAIGPADLGEEILMSVAPSSVLLAGNSLNLTCAFTRHVNADRVVFLAAPHENPTYDISVDLNLAGQTMAPNDRITFTVSSDGVAVTFMYNYTETADSGAYMCYVPFGVSSNQLTIKVLDFIPTNDTTTQAVPSFFLDWQSSKLDTVTVAVSLSVGLGVCLIVAIVALVVRLRYPHRFSGMFSFRRLRSANAADGNRLHDDCSRFGVTESNPLPSYGTPTKYSNHNVYIPPAYEQTMYGESPLNDCFNYTPLGVQNATAGAGASTSSSVYCVAGPAASMDKPDAIF